MKNEKAFINVCYNYWYDVILLEEELCAVCQGLLLCTTLSRVGILLRWNTSVPLTMQQFLQMSVVKIQPVYWFVHIIIIIITITARINFKLP